MRMMRLISRHSCAGIDGAASIHSSHIIKTSHLHDGVDYAGPFIMKTWHGRSNRTYKGFLVLFICFATSAVHLELATDYFTQDFLAAFKRFTGRRGICASLSDRGTNFVGADAELRCMLDAASREHSEIANLLASNGTEWRFNPPVAPHFGGKWEAAVKSTKFYLRRLIGDASLTYEEFSTLLIQIESILNSRPLCPFSDDPSDVEALTPAHFRQLTCLNSRTFIEGCTDRKNPVGNVCAKSQINFGLDGCENTSNDFRILPSGALLHSSSKSGPWFCLWMIGFLHLNGRSDGLLKFPQEPMA